MQVVVVPNVPWDSTHPEDSTPAYSNAVNLYLTNTGSSSLDLPLRLSVSSPALVGVASTWNAELLNFTEGDFDLEVRTSG